ncbi:MAG: hypothetical protein GY940_31695, partial [bacterium]|nr:hypothetical protein [bacterium]
MVEEKEYYPLSSSQKRMYLLYQMAPESTVYNMPAAMNLEGVIDGEKFVTTFRYLIRRHESLRTSFHLVSEVPVQRVHSSVDFTVRESVEPLPGDECPSLNGVNGGVSEFVHPFDLSHAPLFRAGLIKCGPGMQTLILDMHHIITDGLSTGILINEFMAVYSGEEFPPLRLQYKDFVGWQNHRDPMQATARQNMYWEQHFSREGPLLQLPTD